MTSQRKLTREEILALDFSHDITVDHGDGEYGPSDDGEAFKNWTYAGVTLKSACGVSIVLSVIIAGEGTTYATAHKYEAYLNEDGVSEHIIEGAILVDEDGDPLDDACTREILEEIADEYHWEEAAIASMPAPEIEDLEEETMSDDPNAETITVRRDNDRDLRFRGVLIADVSSPERVGRYTNLRLYRTVGGKYVCQEIGVTYWENEHDRFRTAVFENEEGVIEFFGTGWLAKELYESAEIEAVEDLD